ncbi:MAG: hypothetical protein QXE55_06875 [Saccharolobus sp.]
MVDASLRIGILNILKGKLNLAMVFITHDIPITRYFYHLIKQGVTTIMFAGRIVEENPDKPKKLVKVVRE